MKHFLFVFSFLLCTLCAKAEKPYGHYIVKYIVTKDNNIIQYHNIFNPLTITHSGISVKNTNTGDKYWQTTYQGWSDKKIGKTYEIFYKFYLPNQYVVFWISDRPFFRYNNTNYYVIRFDGQIQLATKRN